MSLLIYLYGICFLQPIIVNSFLTPRRTVATLTVSNGERYGTWGSTRYCADGTYAAGYNMKIEASQHYGDDTGLNGVQLLCQDLDAVHFGGVIESSSGPWGNWVGETACSNRNGSAFFLTSFSLQVEPWANNNDDTSANYIKFQCRDFAGSQSSYELARSPGHGDFGSYGGWSASCPSNSKPYVVLLQK